MLQFSSERERRLWMWTALLLVAIYSTLGLASSLASVLHASNLMRTASAVAFGLCLLTVGGTILTQGLKVRPRGVELGLALGIAVVYFLVFLRTTIPERSHLMEYGVVAVFVYEALLERASQGRRVILPGCTAIVLTALAGTLDEYIQLVLPSRHFQYEDIVFNVLAAVMAVAATASLRWISK